MTTVLDINTYKNKTFLDADRADDKHNQTADENMSEQQFNAVMENNELSIDSTITSETLKPEEPTYRQKLAETTLLVWNMMTAGMLFGQMGPALPDFQRITGSSLQEVVQLFTGYGIGYIIGCLLPGITFGRFNSRVLQFLHTLGTALTLAVLPWIPILYVSVAVRVLQGITVGCQGTVNHIMVFQIWTTSSGPYLQVMYTAMGVGGVVSPLFTKPFLGDEEEFTGEKGLTTPSMENFTTPVLNKTNIDHLGSDSRIHYAFIINAILSLSSSLSFLVFHVCQVKDPSSSVSEVKRQSEERNVPVKLRNIILVLMHVICFIISACIFNFANLLATFLIRQLNWSPQAAATLTSVYYGMFGMGNLLGIFWLKFAAVVKLIIADYVGTIACLTGCIICSFEGQTVAVWVFITVAGLTIAMSLPTLYTWIEETVAHVTGRLASSTLVSGSIGVMLYPILAGYLMDTFSPMWFLYLNVGGFTLCAFLFAVSFMLSKLSSQSN